MIIITNKKLIKKTGKYKVFSEDWEVNKCDGPMKMISYYNHNDVYIGMEKEAKYLCDERGIFPEKIDIDHSTCSIGFNKEEQKWYGWSHRAIFGFGIGHVTKKGDCQTESGWTEEFLINNPEEREKVIKPGFVCETLDDCRKVAIAFASSVS